METRIKPDDFNGEERKTVERKPKTGFKSPEFLDDEDLWVIISSSLIAPATGLILGNNTSIASPFADKPTCTRLVLLDATGTSPPALQIHSSLSQVLNLTLVAWALGE